jgi:hypothetical protein
VLGAVATFFVISAPLLYAMELMWVAFIALALFVSISAYRRSRQTEFYEDFVRVIPHIGKPMDLPYSGMIFETRPWRNGPRMIGELYYKGVGRKPLILPDRQIEGLKTDLFSWLAAKTGQLSAGIQSKADQP